jgi:pyruvate,orthophosphate dikinase
MEQLPTPDASTRAMDKGAAEAVSYVYDYDHPFDLPLPELKELVGGKAANLAVMATELGLPVPPAFIVTTTACKQYLVAGWPAGLDDEIRNHVTRMEERLQRRFGDAVDPLLVSVRSGASVSMPGMMDTILNLGLTDSTTAALAGATGNAQFADDCQRRFRTMYRNVVGVDAPDDPWQQLRGAVEAVFRSWNSDRAKAYREHEGIPDDLGTAVTVQAMVFGNRCERSGTGVLFTRNPATGERALYGDVMFQAQGEDVVAGTHQTLPIAVLDERLPEVGAQLRHYADELERHYADLCDIEFTIEQGTLWMLQVRVGKRSPQAALRVAVEMAEDPDFPLTRAEAVRRVAGILANPPTVATEQPDHAPALARGLPASPGVASGEIALTPEAAAAAGDAGRSAILVRSETSPDDVHGMAKSAGILTASGGLASHAAVVARGWGIPAVVGAAGVRVAEGGVVIGGRSFVGGEQITIDGSTGEVFAGTIVGSRVVVPEAATLLEWARELGIEIGGSAAGPEGLPAQPGAEPSAPAAITATPSPATDVDAAIRVLAIKGFAAPDALAIALRSSQEDAAALLDRLVADGLVEPAVGSFRLTTDGKAVGERLLGEDAERWGVTRALAALDAFIVLDGRMKGTVTAWQTREVDGAQTFNDHSDPAYDAAVLADLTKLADDADRWLAPLVDELPRLGGYRTRLGQAAAQATGGDGRYVASPRVDSYHSVWFELHEDLIRLAGRSRAEEVAAGRA